MSHTHFFSSTEVFKWAPNLENLGTKPLAFAPDGWAAMVNGSQLCIERRDLLIPRNHPGSQSSLLNCIITSWLPKHTHGPCSRAWEFISDHGSIWLAVTGAPWSSNDAFSRCCIVFITLIINGFMVFYQLDVSITMLIQSSNAGYLVTCKFLL